MPLSSMAMRKGEWEKTMRVLEKITKGITDVLGVIAGVMITVMMLLAVLDVVLRTFFTSPIIGATEIIQILNVGIVVALVYFLTPVDMIPDTIPGAGHLDDAAVILFAVKAAHNDITDYKKWKGL